MGKRRAMNEVKTYTLSPEELEEVRKKYGWGKEPTKKKERPEPIKKEKPKKEPKPNKQPKPKKEPKPKAPPRSKAKPKICRIDNCEKRSTRKQMCAMHYYRQKRNGSPETLRKGQKHWVDGYTMKCGRKVEGFWRNSR